ncbi:unnamed protein product [Anisakis simplex]|uniref:Probable Golgi SNAP receptor complex member 2 (inferred by orthology to a C. elegans protein) n=1 Tax=Anisakis simplex TaxID=6269 RepID=A0A0M3JT75_ANISI|nr:unnamed protein product [Anisakis simplex]
MESLYNQTGALLQQIHFGLGALENAKDESDAQKTVQMIYEQLKFRPNESTQLSMDDGELMLNDRLHSSNNAVDELINHGSAILEQIRSQGFGLRGIKRRVLDIGQQLGLSSTTLRMIERRVNEDWVIFVIGCVFVIVFMYVFYRFWKG